MATPRKHWLKLKYPLPHGPCVYLLTAAKSCETIQCKIGSTIDLTRRIRELRAERWWRFFAFIPCADEFEARDLEEEVLEEMEFPRGGNSREVRWIPQPVVEALLDGE